MDQVEKRLNKKKFLKRTLKYVFSISAFSIFLCYYSSDFFIHSQTFNANFFCTCLFTIFTHTLERKYMFLICNGILAFLAKNLFIITTTSSDYDFDQFHASDDMVVAPLASFESLEEVSLMAEELEEEYYEKQVSEAEEHKEDTLNIQNEGIDEEEVTETEVDANVLAQDYADDDEVDETTLTTNEELANTEELNRKFEEFIRKMKEEMRIEAQTHLIAV
ncbi:hypothetical protein MtrunA17_Chr2g0290381 [Medicago truncatula]|uniref:Transmembrane protein, putative n=1 Tax=Medicago truncatula TaxID=3880 RepID=A0A072VFN6_MEDTR|nr:uncharacterized protein LOC25486247 [Medicago truncatula]KEH36970.1 transmembrane protein, putative [Medicago truncatula]RHN72678.1 hypothetical protein MtrunA17_Chr2g0290381 [Medicago truncatula]